MKEPRQIGEIIEARMQELGLTRRDLEPIIGSRSKVSEIISGERDITMPMARALYKHLNIPADVLLQERLDPPTGKELDYKKFPLREMANKGWIQSNSEQTPQELIEGLRERAGDDATTFLTRKNDLKRANAKLNPYALLAWQWQVHAQASELKDLPPYKGCITEEDMRKVAQMSPVSLGPLHAVEYLQKECGIPVVYVPHLSRTYLDAATLITPNGPIIGISLRYDRLDSFWYTIEHELAHINKHSDRRDIKVFIDDNSMKIEDTETNTLEIEADRGARNALIPDEIWDESELGKDSTPLDVMEFASEVGVHPAIVAGRIRHVTGNYRRLSQMVGSKKVRQLFELAQQRE